jgi:hypothetical protein
MLEAEILVSVEIGWLHVLAFNGAAIVTSRLLSFGGNSSPFPPSFPGVIRHACECEGAGRA